MCRLYAGVAHVDITPELGHNLAGWVEARPATRRATPIMARALALVAGETQVVLLACDLIWLPEALAKRVQAAVQEKCGVPPQHVFIFPSHNHYGPSVDPSPWSYADAQTVQEVAYIEALPARFAAAARAALDGLKPARWGIGLGKEETVCHNSRFWRKDGAINWVGDRSTHWASDSGPIDPEIGILFISDERGSPIATLYNYACHANCAEEAGFSTLSWDWVGYASQAIESALGGEALFLLGACGNIHPVREGVASAMGRKLAETVISAVQGIETTGLASLAARQQAIQVPARDFDSFDARQIETFCSQLRDEATRASVQAVFLAELQTLKARKTSHYVTQISAIRLDDLAIACIPGEFFVELGLEIKRRSPFAHTFVAELVNGAIGYIPTQHAYQEGGYQVAGAARVAPGGGEQIVEESLALLRGLRL